MEQCPGGSEGVSCFVSLHHEPAKLGPELRAVLDAATKCKEKAQGFAPGPPPWRRLLLFLEAAWFPLHLMAPLPWHVAQHGGGVVGLLSNTETMRGLKREAPNPWEWGVQRFWGSELAGEMPVDISQPQISLLHLPFLL